VEAEAARLIGNSGSKSSSLEEFGPGIYAEDKRDEQRLGKKRTSAEPPLLREVEPGGRLQK
jgi:hypothetical protein